jgi:hypothetical protein
LTLFPLKGVAIGACTPRHFCFGATPLFPLELRGLAKSKMPSSRGESDGHAPLESVSNVLRTCLWRVGFGVAPKPSFLKVALRGSALSFRTEIDRIKVREPETASPARETRTLPYVSAMH